MVCLLNYVKDSIPKGKQEIFLNMLIAISTAFVIHNGKYNQVKQTGEIKIGENIKKGQGLSKKEVLGLRAEYV